MNKRFVPSFIKYFSKQHIHDSLTNNQSETIQSPYVVIPRAQTEFKHSMLVLDFNGGGYISGFMNAAFDEPKQNNYNGGKSFFASLEYRGDKEMVVNDNWAKRISISPMEELSVNGGIVGYHESAGITKAIEPDYYKELCDQYESRTRVLNHFFTYTPDSVNHKNDYQSMSDFLNSKTRYLATEKGQAQFIGYTNHILSAYYEKTNNEAFLANSTEAQKAVAIEKIMNDPEMMKIEQQAREKFNYDFYQFRIDEIKTILMYHEIVIEPNKILEENKLFTAEELEAKRIAEAEANGEEFHKPKFLNPLNDYETSPAMSNIQNAYKNEFEQQKLSNVEIYKLQTELKDLESRITFYQLKNVWFDYFEKDEQIARRNLTKQDPTLEYSREDCLVEVASSKINHLDYCQNLFDEIYNQNYKILKQALGEEVALNKKTVMDYTAETIASLDDADKVKFEENLKRLNYLQNIIDVHDERKLPNLKFDMKTMHEHVVLTEQVKVMSEKFFTQEEMNQFKNYDASQKMLNELAEQNDKFTQNIFELKMNCFIAQESKNKEALDKYTNILNKEVLKAEICQQKLDIMSLHLHNQEWHNNSKEMQTLKEETGKLFSPSDNFYEKSSLFIESYRLFLEIEKKYEQLEKSYAKQTELLEKVPESDIAKIQQELENTGKALHTTLAKKEALEEYIFTRQMADRINLIDKLENHDLITIYKSDSTTRDFVLQNENNKDCVQAMSIHQTEQPVPTIVVEDNDKKVYFINEQLPKLNKNALEKLQKQIIHDKDILEGKVAQVYQSDFQERAAELQEGLHKSFTQSDSILKTALEKGLDKDVLDALTHTIDQTTDPVKREMLQSEYNATKELIELQENLQNKGRSLDIVFSPKEIEMIQSETHQAITRNHDAFLESKDNLKVFIAEKYNETQNAIEQLKYESNQEVVKQSSMDIQESLLVLKESSVKLKIMEEHEALYKRVNDCLLGIDSLDLHNKRMEVINNQITLSFSQIDRDYLEALKDKINDISELKHQVEENEKQIQLEKLTMNDSQSTIDKNNEQIKEINKFEMENESNYDERDELNKKAVIKANLEIEISNKQQEVLDAQNKIEQLTAQIDTLNKEIKDIESIKNNTYQMNEVDKSEEFKKYCKTLDESCQKIVEDGIKDFDINNDKCRNLDLKPATLETSIHTAAEFSTAYKEILNEREKTSEKENTLENEEKSKEEKSKADELER